MWTIRTTFLAPAMGHYVELDGRKEYVIDNAPEMVTRDLHLRLEQAQAIELVKRWNEEKYETYAAKGMRPVYHAALIED